MLGLQGLVHYPEVLGEELKSLVSVVESVNSLLEVVEEGLVEGVGVRLRLEHLVRQDVQKLRGELGLFNSQEGRGRVVSPLTSELKVINNHQSLLQNEAEEVDHISMTSSHIKEKLEIGSRLGLLKLLQ